MARTQEEIAISLANSIEATDPTLDTEQGPIPDVMIRPQAGELAIASTEAEELRQLFTIQFPEVATADEIRLGLGNYGSTPGSGTKARVLQYFLRFSRPDTDIVFDVGSLVGNSDASLQYKILSSITMFASSADTYFNPTRGAYEIATIVEATGVGPQYELPSGRINRILTPIIGIDSTENRTKARGGTNQESTDSQSNRLKTSLLGLNQGGPGGISKRILDVASSIISDVSVVQPFDVEWSRVIDGPALDIYVIGSTIINDTMTVTATAGQTQVFLRNTPALSLNSVLINGVASPITFTLIADQSPETGLSLEATDFVNFDTPLAFGDVVVIDYNYNQALQNANSIVYSNGQDYLFNTDILLRSPFPISPVISGDIRTLPSYTADDVEAQVLAYIASTFTFTTFQTLILPETFRQNLVSSVPGIQTFRLSTFHRNTGALADVEALNYSKREYSQVDSTLININVVR